MFLSGNDFTAETPKTYIVLGGHRSGTSFVADSLRSAGVEFKCRGWRTENGRGVRLNRDIIQAAGGLWRDPPSEAALLAAGALHEPQIREIVSILMTPDHEHSLVGFKDPRHVLTARSYLDFLGGDVYLVCVFRRPELVAASLKRKGQVLVEKEGAALSREYGRRSVATIQEFLGI